MSRVAFRFPALQSLDPDSLGGFRLLARLGEGGMGQVFLALSPGGQPAAVKVIRNDFVRDAEFGKRFAREVGAAQKVRGAHLAPLLDAEPQAERPWLATTYVAGPSLRDLVVDNGPLPAGQVTLLAWGIAHALADIHAAKVVHRDLKPANIILDESGPKVIDFGIVKSLAQSVTYSSNSTRIGTPLYMSPEQASGRSVDAASDVFALGSTLYFLATGCEAFAAENEWAVAHRVVADAPDLSSIPPPLRRLITDCLHKEPEQRPAPTRLLAWCEEELGAALGPGAWMGINGARVAVRERTSALRALTASDAATADTGSGDQPDSPGTEGTSDLTATAVLPPPPRTRVMDSTQPPGAPKPAPRAAQSVAQAADAEIPGEARRRDATKRRRRAHLALKIPVAMIALLGVYLGLYVFAIGSDLKDAKAGDCLWFDTTADRAANGYTYNDVTRTEPCALPFRMFGNSHYVVLKRIDGTNDHSECNQVPGAVVDADTSILKSASPPYWSLCVKPM
ncbi:serine/threonine-protein kinase [Streptomyces sp. NPDC048506]|uniref:serine/threonine protein kinase n=1 Tax=Streptomyces sp. NPDC048506 TaxID=3155028 RepID=UPI0034148936